MERRERRCSTYPTRVTHQYRRLEPRNSFSKKKSAPSGTRRHASAQKIDGKREGGKEKERKGEKKD